MRRSRVVLAVLAGMLGLPGTALATFGGENGPIQAYRDFGTPLLVDSETGDAAPAPWSGERNLMAWNADGTRFAYVRNQELRSAAQDGTDDRLVGTAGDRFSHIAYTRDGRLLAIVRDAPDATQKGVLYPAAGGTPRTLVANADRIEGVQASWFPDPTNAGVAYIVNADPEAFVKPYASKRQLRRVDLATGAITKLEGPVQDGAVFRDISPDGKRLLGQRSDEAWLGDWIDQDLATNRQRVLRDDVGYVIEPVAYSPDGRSIVFAVQSGERRIGLTNADGTGVRDLAAGRPQAWLQPSRRAPFAVREWPGGDPGTYRVQTEWDAAKADGQAPYTYRWDWGDGTPPDEGEFEFHTYTKPGTYIVRHTVTDFDGRRWTSTREIEVAAPELEVTLGWDEDELEDGRFPIGKPVDVRVEVSASCDGVGLLEDVRFDEDAVLVADLHNGAVSLGEAPVPDEGFELARCTSRTIVVPVTGTQHGNVTLRSGVAGTDGTGERQTDTAGRGVRVGHDLRLTVTPAPDELELEIDPDTNEPIPKPLTVTVKVANVSGEPLRDVTLDVSARNRAQQQTDTRGIHWKAIKAHGSTPATPLEPEADPETLVLGDFAAGAAATRRFEAVAVDKSIVRVTGIARGLTDEAQPREVSGNEHGTVLVDQPKLVAVDGGPKPPTRLLAPGEQWHYRPVIENLSPDEEVLVRVLTTPTGNVVGPSVTDATSPSDSLLGDIKELEPGEKWFLEGEYTVLADGATRGTVQLTVDAWTSPFKTPDAVDPERYEIEPGALKRQVRVDQRVPNPPTIEFAWANRGELAWMFTRNFAVSGARALAGTLELLWIPGHIKRGSVALYYGVQRVWSSLSKDEISRIVDEVAADVAALGRYETYEAARAAVDQKVQALLLAPANAWDRGDAGYLAGATGSLFGTVGADLLTAGIARAAHAKAMTSGLGKIALERQFAAQAATLAGRTTGIGAAGRAGLQAGDLLDFALARRLWGIDRALDGKLLDYARRNKLIVAMRDRSPGSIARLAEGLLPKIEKVKAKNVNSIDIEFLGFAESHRDIAMIKQMPTLQQLEAKLGGLTAERREMVLARWQTRSDEWAGPIRRELEAYHQRGSIPTPGGKWGLNPTSNGIRDAENVWSVAGFKLPNSVDAGFGATQDGLKAFVPMVEGTGKKGKGSWALTGDMDPIAILDENGQLLAMERRVQVYKDLARMGFQHPESLTWDNEAGRLKYLFDYDLANARAESLLAYTPTGERRAVYFDSRKSAFELTGAIGDRSRAGRAARAAMQPAAVGSEADRGGGLFFLDGAPMSWDAPVVPITPFAGDVTLEADPDAPLYVSPAGEDGATLTGDPSDPTVRRNPDGSYSRLGGGAAPRSRLTRAALRVTAAWEPFARPPGPLRLRTQTGVREAAAAGATSVPVVSLAAMDLGDGPQAWFAPGAVVVLDPGGPAEETTTVASATDDVLTLAGPMARDHGIGELVILAPPEPVVAGGVTPGVAQPAPATPRPGTRPAAPRDTTKPRLRGVALTRRRLTLRVSEAARVRVTVARNAGRKWRTVKTLALRARKAGRVAARVTLPRGRYRVTLVATDTAGNRARVTLVERVRR